MRGGSPAPVAVRGAGRASGDVAGAASVLVVGITSVSVVVDASAGDASSGDDWG